MTTHKRKPSLAYLEFKLLAVTPGPDEVIKHPPAASVLAHGQPTRVMHRYATVRKRVVCGILNKAREAN